MNSKSVDRTRLPNPAPKRTNYVNVMWRSFLAFRNQSISVLRFLLLAVATTSLIALVSCSSTPPTNTSVEASPTASEATSSSPMHSHGSDAKININTAILSELDKLEAKLGVPALSNKIQAARPYASPEELVAKKVVTQAQFDQIKEMVTIEDIVLTGEAKDVDYMTKLALMKGHMLVAKELLDLNQPKQAEPHIGHPVEEIYVDVEDQLQERNVKEFKTTLVNLQDLVKSNPKDPKLTANFQAAMQSVEGAIEVLPTTQRQSPEFVLKVIDGLLDTAGTEYMAAIANGKISEIIEYQDSRGFVTYANTLYEGVAKQVAKEHPESHKTIESTLTQLKKAWPTATAPAAPTMTTTEVSQLIKAIEQGSQPVTVAEK